MLPLCSRFEYFWALLFHYNSVNILPFPATCHTKIWEQLLEYFYCLIFWYIPIWYVFSRFADSIFEIIFKDCCAKIIFWWIHFSLVVSKCLIKLSSSRFEPRGNSCLYLICLAFFFDLLLSGLCCLENLGIRRSNLKGSHWSLWFDFSIWIRRWRSE